MARSSRTAVVAALLGAWAFAPATAASLRWANGSDVASLDPYARHETFLMSFDGNIYEPLVRRGRELKLEPALAMEWSQTAPDVWRFKLRHGVRFQDGTPFTADDVVFSFARVTAPGSALGEVVGSISAVRKVDDHTVDIVTKGADPTLPDEIAAWDMMSKAWCETNNATRVAEVGGNEESYAASHANGTGPFLVKEREPDLRTVLTRNPQWWDKPEHNLDQVVFRPIPDDEARVTALLKGDLDMIYDVPAQDVDRLVKAPHLRIFHGPELRTVFLGFDIGRAQLADSDVKGRNPFRDIRVRRAFYQAIDEEAIKSRVMHGFAAPTGLMVGPGVTGFDHALDRRLLPYDPDAAKQLLVEAGYPHGFELGMDCPNDRYVNDEGICEAVVAMLAKIGVTVHARIDTRAKFFARILAPNYQTSFYLLGWTPATYDAQDMLFNLVATRDGQGRGDYNVGNYSNPRLDALIDRLESESDEKKRRELLHDALRIVKEDVVTIPLHQQVLIWAARDNVELVQPADNYFPLRYVRVK